MKRNVSLLTLALPLILGSCSLFGNKQATATLINPDGAVAGQATFTPEGNGLHVRVQVAKTVLAPGPRAMHIHENPSCDSIARVGQTYTLFSGAGDHFDSGHSGHHRGPDSTNDMGHAGDLPMITIDASGSGTADFHTDRLTLTGPTGVIGRSIIIHADPDDYKTDPMGNSGRRYACGIIK